MDVICDCPLNRPKQVLSVDPVQWHEGGNFRFYFEKRYDSRSQSFHDLEGDVIKKYSNPSRYPEEEGRHPEVRLGPCANDKWGWGSIHNSQSKRGCVISIVIILTWGNGSEIPKI